MRPKFTLGLLVRTVGFLVFLTWGAWSVFHVPGGTVLMRAAVGIVFGVLLAETLLPFLRALPVVSEKADFLLAAVQYVVIPVLGIIILILAVGSLFFAGELGTRTAVKAGTTGVVLGAAVVTFVRKTWKQYQRERSKTRQERLAELDNAYHMGTISQEIYLERKEAIYESMWKVEARWEGK